MENWIIYSLVTSILVGCYWFSQKIKAEHPDQSDTWFIFYTNVVLFFTWLFGTFIFWDIWDVYNKDIALYSFLIMFLYIIITKTRLISLRYISSSTYFINYRILSSLWLLLIWITLFQESITFQEIVWVLVGFVVFYLLIEKKSHWESRSDVQIGFIYLFIWSICIAGLQSVSKDFALSGYSVLALAFYSGIFWILFSLILKWKEPIRDIVRVKKYQYALFLVVSGMIFAMASITNNLAFIEGDLAIVYKIISYSLFIPIILSIIIYKEPVTPKKVWAFILTILSILLFI